MINTIFYTLIGIPTGYVMSIFIGDIYNRLYKKNISNIVKYSIITSIVFFGFLKGYTGNDLVRNIMLCFD
jgi:hypothetical protein